MLREIIEVAEVVPLGCRCMSTPFCCHFTNADRYTVHSMFNGHCLLDILHQLVCSYLGTCRGFPFFVVVNLVVGSLEMCGNILAYFIKKLLLWTLCLA